MHSRRSISWKSDLFRYPRRSVWQTRGIQAELTEVTIAGPYRSYLRGRRHDLFQDERGTGLRAGRRNRYADWGVDVEAAARAAAAHCDLAALLAGRRRRRVREHRARSSAAAWPSPASIPGKARTADELRADLDKTLALLPGSHRLNLHASYAETGGRKVERDALEPEHFQNWIDWAKSRRIGMDFNPTYFAHPLAADGYTLTHADQADPPVLDRPRDRLPPHRRARSARPWARRASPTSGSPTVPRTVPIDRNGPAPAARRFARRDLRRADRPAVQPRRGRGQAVRHRLGELRRRLARVLLRLCRLAAQAPVPGRRPLPSDRGRLRQDLGRAHVPRRDPAARQPGSAVGQRPRGDPLRRAAGDRPGAGPRRLPGPGAYRPRLLRRQHQPGGGLGHRRTVHAQGALARLARADRDCCAGSRPRAIRPPGWRSSKS